MLDAILIDDEGYSTEMLASMLEKIGGIKIRKGYENPIVFITDLQKRRIQYIDVVFIDIEMPNINGIEVAETIQQLEPSILIVFVTAYSEYAVTAFELNSIDYLVKPVLEKRLKKTVSRLQTASAEEKERVKQSKERQLFIQCFGDFVIYGSDGQPLKWRTKKVKSLCALLVHYHYRFITLEELTEKLFEDLPYEKAKINFYTTMSSLRKMFRLAGYPNIIQKEGKGYKLSLDEVTSDIQQFEFLIDNNASILEHNAPIFLDFLEAYKGEYLETVDRIELISKREELNLKVIDTFRNLVTFYLQHDQIHQATMVLTKLTELFPYSEKDQLNLIRLHADNGDYVTALHLYQTFKKYLNEELNIEPSKEITTYISSFI